MIQAVSVIGAALILAAYAGMQARRLDPGKLPFSVTNALGSALLACVAVVEEQVGFVLLEGVWCLVSLWGIVRAWPGRATGEL
jgi:hypothetical protein